MDLKAKREMLIEEYNKAINTIKALEQRVIGISAQINLLDEIEKEEGGAIDGTD